MTPSQPLEETQQDIDISAFVERALQEGNAAELNDLLDSVTISEALRVVLEFSPDERDRLIFLISAELASRLIDEAPLELAGELMERQRKEKAAEIFDELDSDVQADVIAELDTDDAEAILAAIAPEDAAAVRRLTEYDADTAGGLMLADAFKFRSDHLAQSSRVH